MPKISTEKNMGSAPALDKEVALAIRIIRTGCVPQALFQWLATPERMGDCGDDLVDTAITNSLNEILSPLIADARDWEKKESRHAARWIGAACVKVSRDARKLDLGIGARLLSASLLPIYRSLASGELHEGLQQTRLRMSELLCLVALAEDLGNDLVHLLDSGNRKMVAPSLILREHVDIDLTRIAELVRKYAGQFDVAASAFDAASTEELQTLRIPGGQSCVHECWAAPELLWRLSGELISKSSEIVLPRSWISIPVPWASISAHWHALARLLSASAEAAVVVANEPDSALAHRSTVVALSTTPPAELAPMPVDEKVATSEAEAQFEPRSTGASEYEVTNALLATPPLAATELFELPPMPKVLIAEIRSHNDPAFVHVVRRQIAKCRAEDRAISLVSIIVLSENENNHLEVRENGLTLWQQKLVNWLAEHPQVIEPYAFLTSEGELILCVLDMERNEATSLIRHGLIEVLIGKHVEDSNSILAKVVVPARYHAGIASTSSPGATFTPEQLIEPAVRCLSAASRQGKASIKSIEVY